MTQGLRDDGAVPARASIWSGQARALRAAGTRSAGAPRRTGHPLAALGLRTDLDPDDQVPVLHWDKPPGMDHRATPALPILVRATDLADRRTDDLADRRTDEPAGAGLPRQRTPDPDGATSAAGAAAARHLATHFHPPRMR